MEIYEDDGYIIDPRFPGNKIHETAIISSNVSMGKGNIIMPYAVIGQSGFIRDGKKPEGIVTIGDENVIGLYVNIMAGIEGVTYIGANNLIMNHANIGHNVSIAYDCEVGAGSVLNGYCDIRHDVKIKSNCTIRNRIKIGEGSIIGQASNVIKDVKEGMVIVGNPAKIL